MPGLLARNGKRRVFILGAGFNAPLGMPLTAELLSEVHSVAARKPWHGRNGKPALRGMADWLVETLNWYYPTAGIDHKGIESGAAAKTFNLEEFLSFVAATSAMQLKSGQRWDEQGDEFSGHLKAWLGEAIELQQRAGMKHLPGYYLKFIDSLQDAVVLTFNWDTVLERLLERRGVAYRFDLDGALAEGAVPLIKMHGSVDWFSMNVEQDRGKPDWLRLDPVGDSFEGLGRARGDLLRCYEHKLTPWMVLPSFDKIFQMLNLGKVWQLPWLWLEDELEIVVIGYSIRPDDYHSRAFMYPRLVRGSRNGMRVKVVDHADSDAKRQEVQQRFAGVHGCRFCYEGFSGKALEFIERG